MPKLTWTMEEGIVGEWHKAIGDHVDKGATLCEIETEKSVDELKAPESGFLRKILFPKGSVVKVNELIAVIAGVNEPLPDEITGEVQEKPLTQKTFLSTSEDTAKISAPEIHSPKSYQLLTRSLKSKAQTRYKSELQEQRVVS